jgi:Tfp pilus assembly protein PilN
MKWTKHLSALAHAAKARKRMESLPEPELVRVPAGEYLGCLQWHAANGEVKRWAITQGMRANNITVEALIYGKDRKRRISTFTALLARLRKCLSIPRRLYD